MAYEVIKQKLTQDEYYEFINTVLYFCFSENEEGKVIYTPSNKSLGIKFAYAKFYTDIDIENVDWYGELFDLDFNTINNVQLNDILNAIDEEIDYKKQQLLKQTGLEDMFEAVNKLIETVTEKLKEVDAKGLEKFIKKMTPANVTKQYMKTQYADSKREELITSLQNQIKELKNQISASNVVTDKVN